MTWTVAVKPFSWYVGKLERREAFTSLLYGDGEFHVMLGDRMHQPFTHYREIVTPRMVEEMQNSLDVSDPSIIRGTDRSIIDWESYKGQDIHTVRAISMRVQTWLTARRAAGHRPVEWLDGTIWDTAMRNGELGPMFRALKDRPVILVGNPKLRCVESFLSLAAFVEVPPENAYALIDRLESTIYHLLESSGLDPVVLLCMGLGAIPLAIRIKVRTPAATCLDLGSVLDIFARIGAERGWRNELYADQDRYADVVRKNIEG